MESGRYGELIAVVAEARREKCFSHRLPGLATELSDATLALLFPHFAESHPCDESDLRQEIKHVEALIDAVRETLVPSDAALPNDLAERFLTGLPEVRASLIRDAEATYQGDPAARSVDEVILAYPGFLAIALHRVAHVLHRAGARILPRLVSAVAQRRTGIDIHPGARIGPSFMIDHGIGVVIGETAVVGHGVKVYQGVTLGAAAVAKSLADQKRHPTVEDNVILYANATVLGGDTVIGHDSIVGANAWVTESVPPFSVVGRHSEIRPRRSRGEDLVEFVI